MRIPDRSLDAMLSERGLDPRDQIAAIGLVIGMLELASAAFREVPARRVLMMWSGRKPTIVEQGIAGHPEGHVTPALSHAIPARRDANDQLMHCAMALGIAFARSSAIICGPAI